MIGLKVPKKSAEKVRRLLLEHSMIDLNYKIERNKHFIFIPLSEKPGDRFLNKIGLNDLEIIDTKFEVQKRNPKSLKDYLKGNIKDEKIPEIKKSFDIIGDVVILEIPDDLEKEKYQIGEAALKFTKRKAAYRKKSKIKGILRTRELEHLAGEDVSETIHKEYGCKFMLDVKKVYFSPRLATERERIASQVKDGETIVDMFAGVGPFSIVIAKNHEVKIYAIDINPYAYFYIKKNKDINKLKGEIIPLLGDVKEVLKDESIKADRIIMNLPESAHKFLKIASSSLKECGILHYYQFASNFENVIEKLEKGVYPRKVKLLAKRKVKSKSPGVWHMGIDAVLF